MECEKVFEMAGDSSGVLVGLPIASSVSNRRSRSSKMRSYKFLSQPTGQISSTCGKKGKREREGNC
jgi:hypothetical protein